MKKWIALFTLIGLASFAAQTVTDLTLITPTLTNATLNGTTTSTGDIIAANLTVVSTNTFTHAATGVAVAQFRTLTNGIALYVWSATGSVWVVQSEWTED